VDGRARRPCRALPSSRSACAGVNGVSASTGRVSYVGSSSKSSKLFISLLVHLRASYRRAKTITLIVDNYIIHKSHETQRWLKANPKFTVIYQPA